MQYDYPALHMIRRVIKHKNESTYRTYFVFHF